MARQLDMPEHRLPGTLRVLLAASFVSSLGSGLTLPFLVIYLHEVRHIPIGLAGLLIGGVSVLALPVTPWAGALVDRFGARHVVIAAVALQAVGNSSLATVHSTLSALPAMFLYGLGQAAGWPTWNALLGVMVRDDTTSRLAFARNFQLLNLGLGIGAIIGGLVVHVREPGTFVAIYLADGASCMAVVATLFVLPARAFARVGGPGPEGRAPGSDDESSPSGGYRAVLGDRLFRRYALATTVLMLAGYAAVNTGYVGFATTVAKAGPGTIAFAFAGNTTFIVIMQPVALRMCARLRRTTALELVAVAFAASWAVLGLGGIWPGTIASRCLVIAAEVVFAAGEVLLSPVSGPLVNDMAPPALRGRYFAASSVCFTLANIASPAVSGAMLGAGAGGVLLGLFVVACAGAVLATRWLRAVLSPAQDNVPHAPAVRPASDGWPDAGGDGAAG